jgi:1,4-alpha-glucan branching enzyme
MPIPAEATQDGPPVRAGERVLFRFRAPNATRVYLAGSFNGWALNKGGKVTNERFAMQSAGNGIWFKHVTLTPQVHQYKFVVTDKNGKQDWVPDPHVQAKDEDSNTVFDFQPSPCRRYPPNRRPDARSRHSRHPPSRSSSRWMCARSACGFGPIRQILSLSRLA